MLLLNEMADFVKFSLVVASCWTFSLFIDLLYWWLWILFVNYESGFVYSLSNADCFCINLGGWKLKLFSWFYLLWFSSSCPIHYFSSCNDILFDSLTYKHFLMKSLVSLEIFRESLNFIGILVIFSINYFYVLHCQGVSPCSI